MIPKVCTSFPCGLSSTKDIPLVLQPCVSTLRGALTPLPRPVDNSQSIWQRGATGGISLITGTGATAHWQFDRALDVTSRCSGRQRMRRHGQVDWRTLLLSDLSSKEPK